jgi:hypothetical protein
VPHAGQARVTVAVPIAAVVSVVPWTGHR